MHHVLENIYFYMTEVIKLLLVMLGLLNFKLRALSKRLCLYIIALTIFFIILFSNSFSLLKFNGLEYVISFLVITTVVTLIVGKQKYLVTLVTYTGISLFDIVLVGGFQLLLCTEINKNDFKFIIINIISILVILILILIKTKLKISIQMAYLQFRKRYLIIILIGLLGSGFYVALIQNFGLSLNMNNYESFFSLGVYTSGIVFIMICVALLILNDSNAQYKSKNDMNQKLLDQQRLYYQTLIEKEQYTKRFRHDINNHIYCLHHLCENKKYEELTQYLNDMHKFIMDLNQDIQTGNNIVNIIVNDLYQRNKDDKIDIKWRGMLTDDIRISSMDLCTIFSNIFNNAIEAVKKIERNDRKLIEVDIKRLNTNLVINISNPVKDNVIIINNRLVTTKANKDHHGLGSINVERCVKKYKGSLEYSCSNYIFCVSIIFSNIIL